VAEPTRIEDISERVRDFTRALRQAGAEEVAHRIDSYATGFVDSTQVRRAVDAIRQQLRYFRAYPEELPDVPMVQIAANRLEDACKDALRAERIAPARPSLRSQGKRKLRVVLATLIAAAVLLSVPLAVALAGVDVAALIQGYALPVLDVPKGSTVSLYINVLEPSADVSATRAVEFSVLGGCPSELPHGASCRPLGERTFGSLTLPAYEILPRDQAYGIQIGFADMRLSGAVGNARLYVSAGDDAPEGEYLVPLTAAFVGYAPARCNPYLRLTSGCSEAAAGPNLRHDNLPVPLVQLRVVPAGPRRPVTELQSQATLSQPQQGGDERAVLIAGAVRDIKTTLDAVDRELSHRRYEVAERHFEGLTHAFEPLDALAVGAQGADGEALPPEVVSLRARFVAQQKRLARFQDHVFESAYKAFRAPRPHGVTDAHVAARAAHALDISRELLERIYADHADELERRLQQEEAKHSAVEHAALLALQQRCGPLPKAVWRTVHHYLGELAHDHGGKLQLHECLTPRLSPKQCWSVVCDFAQVVSEPGALIDTVKERSWTFHLRGERIIDHLEHVEEASNSPDSP
jgi:hypothetical protein